MPSPLTPGFQYSRASSSKALPPNPTNELTPCYSSHSAPVSRKASFAYSNHEEQRADSPVTPRKTSIAHSSLKSERPRAPRSSVQDKVLSSKTLLVPPETGFSTSKVSDKVPLRPQLKRNAHTQEAPELVARKQSLGHSIFTEWKAPRYEYSDDEYGSSLPASRTASSQGSWAMPDYTQSAEEIAQDYASILPAFVPETICSESDFLPLEMSARITDVSDGSLMTLPLILSSNSEDRKLSSQFSTSDSEIESLLGESKPSLKARAKKAFNSRKTSKESKEKAFADSKQSKHSQAGELSAANLASLQNGIDETYNALTGLYSPAKSKTKNHITNSTNDLNRSVTPSTTDGKYGKRVWDSLKSPKGPAQKKDDSVGKKLASVLQNGATAVGLDRGKESKSKTEE